ncbi:long-chain-fatty-acid--CoA ligase [Chachezhania sediminis]|uniref:long-chain-fatty-acid--CoA ligase n=1 Tax=Chachezhania sediminis TaxID=2599291 RepID=UPI00131DE030|nr:long-chain fatty acid--CoA ligase [Chachezhania sediminis]
MLNISIMLEHSARRRPGHPAIVFGDTQISYAQLDAAANQVANGMRAAGIGRGDKVAISCLNLPYFPMVFFGAAKIGAVLVPLNVLLKPKEIAYHLRDCEAKAYFCFEGNDVLPMGQWGHEAFAQVPGCEIFCAITADPAAPSPFEDTRTLGELMADRSPEYDPEPMSSEDTALIIYTSGTTGDPKGAELSQSNVMMNTMLMRDLLEYRDDDISLLVLPMFHVFGLLVQLASGVYHGVTHVMLPRFDPDLVMKTMIAERITVFCGVPTMYWALLQHDTSEIADLDVVGNALRLCISAGQSIPGATLKAFEKKFNTAIIEGYGMSETSPGITFNRLDMPRKIGSVGTPFWGVEVRVVDADGHSVPPGHRGEIICRGHNVMKGYYNAPEKTASTIVDGWMHTGDIGEFDSEGYLYVVDRLKEMINRGGENIYPTEVEKRLVEHEAISLAAVVPVPSERYGEEIKAFVVLKPGASATPEGIIDWARANMSAQKYPREVEILTELPMTGSGKVMKKSLRTA